MRRAGGVVVLGSATPALDDYARAKAGPLSAGSAARTRDRATVAGDARRRHGARICSRQQPHLQHGAGRRRSASGSSAARRACCSSTAAAPRGSCSAAPAASFPAASAARPRSSCTATRAGCAVTTAMRSGRFPRSARPAARGPIAPYGIGTATRRGRGRSALSRPRASCAWTPIRRRASAITRACSIASRARRRAGRHADGRQRAWISPTVTLVGAIAADLDLHVAGLPRGRTDVRPRRASLRAQRPRAAPAKRSSKRTAPAHPAIVFAAAARLRRLRARRIGRAARAGWPPFVRLVFVGVIGRERARGRDGDRTLRRALRGDGALGSARSGSLSARAVERRVALSASRSRRASSMRCAPPCATASCPPRAGSATFGWW